MKKILALLLAAVLLLSLSACVKKDNQETTEQPAQTTTEAPYTGEKVKVAAIKGPTGMGMVNLMYSNKYEFTLVSDPTQIVAMISTGEVDIAACPLNLAANLYKKTGGNIKMLGLNTLGVLYVVTNGVQLGSIEDLKGKTIYSTGEGATVEFIINYILEKNGVKDDVKVEYLSEHSELASKLAAGEVEIAVLPEPFVTTATSKNDKLTIALNLTDEWRKVDPETKLSMGCVIARSEFVEKNPDMVKQFIEDNKLSVEYVNTNALEACKKMAEKEIIASALYQDSKGEESSDSANGVVSRCNIVFIDAEAMKTIANANFEVYFNSDPASIGGAVPADDLYYVEK